MRIITLVICLSLCGSTAAASSQDSLLQLYRTYLEKAIRLEDKLEEQEDWAQRAADGFAHIQADSLWMEAKLILANVAKYQRDSLEFEARMAEVWQMAESRKDTGALIRAYNKAGQFYFEMGNSARGIAMLKVPEARNYFVPTALEASLNNLGALVDVSLYVTRNVDTAYYYFNRLQHLANNYDDPSVQVVTRFKSAQLLNKAANYGGAVEVLREAYPYLGRMDNKGFLHYYYRELMKNFNLLEMPDSAYHYSEILQQEANYEPGNPRYCQVAISQARAWLMMNKSKLPPDDFEDCFSQLIDGPAGTIYPSRHALEALYVKCNFALRQADWTTFDAYMSILINSAESVRYTYFLQLAYDLKSQAMMERRQFDEALEAFEQYKLNKNRLNNAVFAQAQVMARNKMQLELAEEENKLLQAENNHQKLKIANDRNRLLALVFGLLFLALAIAFLLYLTRVRARQRQELRSLVHQRTQELEKTNQQLTKANDELSASNIELERFAYIASHDLKTPLHNMIKFTGLLRRRLKQYEEEGVQDYLAFIIDGGKRMNTLIEDMLEYSRFSKVDHTGATEITDLNVIVADIGTAISEYLSQRNAVVEIQSPLPSIRWNSARIFILLKNLIENGVKYNKAEVPRIELSTVQEETSYVLVVKDNGIGINTEFTSKVFQMFGRLHTHGEYEGSGLGLATCKKIVGEFGGTISFESELGQGTSFKVLIPAELIIDDSTLPTDITHNARP